MRLPLEQKIDINRYYTTLYDVSTQNIMTVEQAQAQLRRARLAQHKTNISKALQESNDEKLSTACSGFVALYRGQKPKKKGKND